MQLGPGPGRSLGEQLSRRAALGPYGSVRLRIALIDTHRVFLEIEDGVVGIAGVALESSPIRQHQIAIASVRVGALLAAFSHHHTQAIVAAILDEHPLIAVLFAIERFGVEDHPAVIRFLETAGADPRDIGALLCVLLDAFAGGIGPRAHRERQSAQQHDNRDNKDQQRAVESVIADPARIQHRDFVIAIHAAHGQQHRNENCRRNHQCQVGDRFQEQQRKDHIARHFTGRHTRQQRCHPAAQIDEHQYGRHRQQRFAELFEQITVDDGQEVFALKI